MARVKSWLERNKVYFETLAALLLSVAAIVVSCEQTELARLQTDLAQQQWKIEGERAAMHRRTEWQHLRRGIWELFDHLITSGPNAVALKTKNPQEVAAWFGKTFVMLSELEDNQVLMENEECLGYWRAALASASGGATIARFSSADEPTTQEQVDRLVEKIFGNVGFVWEKLVLDSGEISAVGGSSAQRPSQTPRQPSERP